MKKVRILLLTACLILIVCLYCCSIAKKHSFYGTYTFKEVSYLSLLSSSSIDYINEQMAGTKYIIGTDSFRIEYKEKAIEIISPKYVIEEIRENSPMLPNVHSIVGKGVKYQYTIYNKDGSKTGWRLYVSSDYIWVARYITPRDIETITEIDKLTK